MQTTIYKHKGVFNLESGEKLIDIDIAYCTFGKLNADKSNVVWVCHALTANADCADWWSGLVGSGRVIDTDKFFVVCANILGSCYGTTGPLSDNPETHEKYYSSFPLITIRDMVNAHILLRKHLGIDKIKVCMGGSMGGYQVLEWAIMENNCIEKMVLLCTSTRESAWGTAIHTAQRLAIEADETFGKPLSNSGAKGLKAARAIGMLTYRNYKSFVLNQTDEDNSKLDNFKASSYINHQGDKLVNRFNAYSYWTLTKAMDNHNISRRRNNMEMVLNSIKIPTLLIGITSDFLCPVDEQKYIAKHMPQCTFQEIDSDFGHDGFLIEWQKISSAIANFL